MIKRLSLLAASMVLAASANAGMVIDSFTNAFDATPILHGEQLNKTLNLFDTLGGTRVLDSVLVRVDADAKTSFTLEAAETTNGEGSVTFGIDVRFGSLSSNFSLPIFVIQLTDGGNLIGGVPRAFGPLEGSDAYSFLVSQAPILDIFSLDGSGFLEVTCAASTIADARTTEPTSNAVVSLTEEDSFARCGASIKYTYHDAVVNPPTDLPEPGSLALMGLALAALASTARRRKV